MQRKAVLYDKGGDQHYDYISAWIKSTRGSDPDASLYYLAAMLEGGEDARFIARRMVILASEDIGNADPQALPIAVAAAQAVEHVGLPEAPVRARPGGDLPVAGAEVRRRQAGDRRGPRPHPRRRRRASARRAALGRLPGRGELGRGIGYDYPHGHPGHVNDQEHLPEGLRGPALLPPRRDGGRAARAAGADPPRARAMTVDPLAAAPRGDGGGVRARPAGLARRRRSPPARPLRRTHVLDLAAGTGQADRVLAAHAGDVIAVEPLDGMRRVLEARLPQRPRRSPAPRRRSRSPTAPSTRCSSPRRSTGSTSRARPPRSPASCGRAAGWPSCGTWPATRTSRVVRRTRSRWCVEHRDGGQPARRDGTPCRGARRWRPSRGSGRCATTRSTHEQRTDRDGLVAQIASFSSIGGLPADRRAGRARRRAASCSSATASTR